MLRKQGCEWVRAGEVNPGERKASFWEISFGDVAPSLRTPEHSANVLGLAELAGEVADFQALWPKP